MDIAKKIRGIWTSYDVRFFIIVIIIVVSIRLFVVEPFLVIGASMLPTIQSTNYIFSEKITYRFSQPERGDIIIAQHPQENIRIIKRIIGLPNETVTFSQNTITITKNNTTTTLQEPYINSAQYTYKPHSITTNNNQYVLLGDNRSVSVDSRSWGTLEKEGITSKAFMRIFPFTRISLLNN